MKSIHQLPDKVLKARIKKLQYKMAKSRCSRNFIMYQIILLYLKKYSPALISEITGRSMTTFYRYVSIYLNQGLKGLRLKSSPGRTCLLTEEQRKEVYDTVTNKRPKDVGFSVKMNWTANLVRLWIERNFNINYKLRSVLRLLHFLKLSWTRPTYVLAKADPAKQAEFRIEVRNHQKDLCTGKIDRLMFQDESMIRDYQAIQKTWFPKGQQRIVPTYGKHHGVKLIGALDYETGEVVCIYSENYDAQQFLVFLQAVLEKYPQQKIVMVLDNAKIHHAKLIQPFLEEHRAVLKLVFLPPYSPKLNPIEGLWGWLKSDIINNVFYKTVKEIGEAVHEFIEYINQHLELAIERLCTKVY